MKKTFICVLAIFAMLLSGCGTFGTANVEELLRAPQTNASQQTVQAALTSYLGETPTLKYPRGGKEMSPIILRDFDNDGIKEAAVLYITESKGQNVHLAMLEANDDNGWEVVYETEGMSTEVASVEVTSMQNSGPEILVGYANATLSDKYLTVYSYSNETITRLYDQAYTSYITCDLLTKGVRQLVVVPPASQTGALQMLFLDVEDDKMMLLQTCELDERFVSCEGLYASQSGQSHGIVFDGAFSSGGTASEVFKLSAERLSKWPQTQDIDIPRTTLRFLSELSATDFVGSQTYEVPTEIQSFTTLTSTKRFFFVTWQNYLSTRDNVRFGVYDATNGYFVRLPADWKDNVTITDGGQSDTWQVREADSNEMLLTVRLSQSASVTGMYVKCASTGSKNVFIYMSSACTSAQSALIRTGVTIIR